MSTLASPRQHILPPISPEIVIDRIYDAAADPELWDGTLTAIADSLGSTSAILVGHSAGSWREPRFADFGRLDRELNLKGSREDFCESPLVARLGTLGLGQILASDDIMPLAEARRTAWYREMMTPQDIAHCLMTPLMRDHATFGAFFLARGERGGAYSGADIARLERLMPHLRRAAHIRCRIDSYRMLAEEQHALIDCLSTGIILIDETGAARPINRAAEEALGSGLSLRAQTLTAADRHTDTHMKNLIAATAMGGPGATLAVPRPSGREPLLLLICPLRGTIRERLGEPRQQVAIFIKDPAKHGSALLGDVLEQFYSLTPAEARVAVTLASGIGVAGTASCLDVSENTVKMHAKRIYEKLGLNGQVQLAQFYARLAPPIRPASTAIAA